MHICSLELRLLLRNAEDNDSARIEKKGGKKRPDKKQRNLRNMEGRLTKSKWDMNFTYESKVGCIGAF